MKGKQHANVPYIYGKRVNRLRKYLIHVVFVSLSYMLLGKKKKEETQEGALTIKRKKKERLITNGNAIYLPFRQKAVDYNLFYEFVDFGGRECERAEKNRKRLVNKAFDACVCCCALCCTLFTSDIFRGSQWQ